MDGAVSPHRVARVLGQLNPDVVALQEVENTTRSGKPAFQADEIARCLNMHSHFFPLIKNNAGTYGIALLSRYPVGTVQTRLLPKNPTTEPRGALVVSTDFYGKKLTIINTHLSFFPRERHRQCRFIVDAITNRIDSPLILCGDFNMTPRSRSYTLLTRRLADGWQSRHPEESNRTWMGLSCLDYIFVSGVLAVRTIQVPKDTFTRMVSDHRPVIADIAI